MPRLLAISVLCVLLGAGLGYLIGRSQFGYPSTYELERPLKLLSGSQAGLLPPGTHMNYFGSEHNELEFYVFVRIPRDQTQGLFKPVQTDYYNGHRHLNANP